MHSTTPSLLDFCDWSGVCLLCFGHERVVTGLISHLIWHVCLLGFLHCFDSDCSVVLCCCLRSHGITLDEEIANQVPFWACLCVGSGRINTILLNNGRAERTRLRRQHWIGLDFLGKGTG